jgi:hypothetical protein
MNNYNCDRVESLDSIITKAQQGDRTSMGKLAEIAEPRLRTLAGSLGTRLRIAVVTSASALLACITFREVIVSIIVVVLILVGIVITGLYFSFD